MAATFVQISFDAIDSILLDPKLPGNVFRVWLYLSKLDPFGDRGRRLPTLEQIACHLKISVDTVRRSLAKLEELGFIVIDHLKTKSFVNSWKNFKSGLENIRAKFFSSQHECKIKSTDKISPAAVQDKPHLCNFQEPKPLLDKDYEIPQTLQTFDLPQTEKEVEKKNLEEQVSNEEVEVSAEEEADDDESTPPQTAEKVETDNNIVKEARKVTPAVTQNKHKTPQDLLERLRISEVKTSEQVLLKISQHHISQAYGAIAHVENTFATIKDPTAIFLFQLPKQPVEKMGQRYSDELLEKQKRECQAIEKERAKGFMPMSKMPGVAALKAKLAKKTAKKTGLPAPS